MNCPDCKTVELIPREAWIDIDMEYRHVEYLWCCQCDGIFAWNGYRVAIPAKLTTPEPVIDFPL